MSIDQLARLLEETAEDVPEPRLAEGAWARARVLRRRRRVIGSGAAVAVLLGSIAVAGSMQLGGQPEPPSTIVPTTTIPLEPEIDRIPDTLTERTDLPLPRSPGDLGSQKIENLSAKPVSRAVALYEPAVDLNALRPGPVYVLGDDGAFRRLGVTLEWPVDTNKQPALHPLALTSLSPDGKLAAFPQPENVVVVNLTTGHVDRIPVPGFNVQVWWPGDGTLMVGGPPNGVRSVVLATGAVSPTSASIPAKRDWRIGDRTVRMDRSAAWVFDRRTELVIRTLPGPGVVIGMFDTQTVLAHTERGVLAWDVGTGRITSVADPFNGVIALPSP